MSIANKIKSRSKGREPITLTVKYATNLTPNMRRVTLTGEALAKYPKNAEGTYIKLIFDQPETPKPIVRTYTIAEQRYEQREIDVDFMLHTSNDDNANGIAAPWSLSTQPGDKILVGGPGPAKFINTDAGYFLLAADMTALPALTANLQKLPKNAKGHAFIEILSEADKQNLEKPEEVKIHWIINNNPGSEESPLFHAMNEAKLKAGNLAAWVACEFKTMRKIRQLLKTDLEVSKSHLYVSSYWRKGNTEEQHKVIKREDAERAGN